VSGAAVQARYTAHAARHTRPSPVQLADYLAGFRARGQGAWPSQIHLAERFHVSVRTIQRWLTQLIEAGLLAVERSRARHDHITGRWRRRTNRYRCTFKNAGVPKREKPQVTPTRHLCRDEGPFREPCNGSAPESVAIPPWVLEGMTAAEWTKRKMGQL
jgi:hypothetical protein